MKILLAVDASIYSEAAMAAVLSQFVPKSTTVHVFHAADWEQHLPSPYLFAQGREAVKDVFAVRDRILHEAEEYVNGVATRLRAAGFAVTTEIQPEGDPRDAILKAAETSQAELVVVGSHGRSGLERFLLGSVSERVVRHAPCSVQVVRPAAIQRPPEVLP